MSYFPPTPLPSDLAHSVLRGAQVATLLGCAESTIEEMARDGELPGLKFGDAGWVFPLKALLDHLNADAKLKMLARWSERQGGSGGTPCTAPYPIIPPTALDGFATPATARGFFIPAHKTGAM